jgi:hypothetical protein
VEVKDTIYITEIKTQHKNILKMLLYFDIFYYPLNKSELSLVIHDPLELNDTLEELRSSGIIDQDDEWYFITGKKYQKRIVEKSNSPQVYYKARKYASLINKFPFVRGVYISGSLSKDWADETTDVDYFIITAPQRLWICRTLLILFKKVFLLNSRKYFCLNYFIDTSHLEIEEKNIFTATEISFLKPVINESLYNDFISNNAWIKHYYHHPAADRMNLVPSKNSTFKKISEWILGGRLGEWMDIWSMRRTLAFWKKKFPEMKTEEFEINFKSDRTISKHHPSGFQKKVLEELDRKIKEFEGHTSINLR